MLDIGCQLYPEVQVHGCSALLKIMTWLKSLASSRLLTTPPFPTTFYYLCLGGFLWLLAY